MENINTSIILLLIAAIIAGTITLYIHYEYQDNSSKILPSLPLLFKVLFISIGSLLLFETGYVRYFWLILIGLTGIFKLVGLEYILSSIDLGIIIAIIIGSGMVLWEKPKINLIYYPSQHLIGTSLHQL